MHSAWTTLATQVQQLSLGKASLDSVNKSLHHLYSTIKAKKVRYQGKPEEDVLNNIELRIRNAHLILYRTPIWRPLSEEEKIVNFMHYSEQTSKEYPFPTLEIGNNSLASRMHLSYTGIPIHDHIGLILQQSLRYAIFHASFCLDKKKNTMQIEHLNQYSIITKRDIPQALCDFRKEEITYVLQIDDTKESPLSLGEKQDFAIRHYIKLRQKVKDQIGNVCNNQVPS